MTRPAFARPPGGWERIESGPAHRRRLVYWRRRLPDGGWLSVSRDPGWRWLHHDPAWVAEHGTHLTANRRAEGTGFGSSVTARRAADDYLETLQAGT